MSEEAKPLVKWAGGKRQLVDILFKSTPIEFNDYYEPFVGGGALFFKLYSQNKIKRAYLNDYNPDLMNVYAVVKSRPNELIEELKVHGRYPNEKAAYYQIRQNEPEDMVCQAARFVYLNRTGFNGLYRVNSKGKFNVPYGRYKNPKICDEENILLVSEALKKAVLSNKDFEIVRQQAKPKDFVYFDPPYHPISKTSFTSYTKADFSENEQVRLRDVYSELDGRGAFVMLSNSSAPLITELYSNYQTQNVLARRAINCKADKRGPVNEVLVSNWRS